MENKLTHVYESIHGWFFYKEIYDFILSNATNGQHFIEVGAWKGKSASYMAVELANRNLNVQFDVIDTWEGSDVHRQGGPYEDPDVVNGKLYDVFLENMKSVEQYYTPIKMTSVDAAKLYEDNSLDFVLIDADHAYEPVKADIQAWLPKIKPGGYLGGDDYHDGWPGVIQATTELLPGHVNFNGVAWLYQKPLTHQ